MEGIVYDDPNKCVRDNPEAGPCNCPECLKAVADSGYVAKGVVLTDNHLSSPEPITRIAYEFTCTVCGENKNPDYARCCMGCGIPHIKRSHKVLEFIKQHQASLQNNHKV